MDWIKKALLRGELKITEHNNCPFCNPKRKTNVETKLIACEKHLNTLSGSKLPNMGIEEKNYYFNQIKNEANRLGFKFESRPYGTRTPHSFSIVIDGNEVLGVIKYSEDANRIYQGIAASLSRHFSKFTYVIIIDEVLSRVLILPWNLINRTYQRMSGYGTYPHVTFTIERKNGQYMIKGGNYIPDEYVDNVPNTEKVFRVVFNLKEV